MCSTSPRVREPCNTYISVSWLPVLRTEKVVLPAVRAVAAGSHVVLLDTTLTVFFAFVVQAAAPRAAISRQRDRRRINDSSWVAWWSERSVVGQRSGARRLPHGHR